MQPSRRPSGSQVGPRPNDHQQVSRYLDFIRNSLKTHLRDRNFTFDQTEIKDLGRLVSSVRQHHANCQRQQQESRELKEQKEALSVQLQETLAQQGSQLSVLRQKLEQKDREFARQLLAVENEFGRKQQAFKEVIERLMAALGLAQKKYQELQSKCQNEVAQLANALQRCRRTQERGKQVSGALKHLAEEITLRQENSIISSKSDGQLSLDDLELGAGAIEEPPSSSLSCAESFERQVQGWLQRLICFGLFENCNAGLIKKMLSLAREREDPSQLLEEKVFPAISDLLVSNMRAHEQSGWRYLRGAEAQSIRVGSGIELRNINNLSQLDVNSLCELSVHEQDDSRRCRNS